MNAIPEYICHQCGARFYSEAQYLKHWERPHHDDKMAQRAEIREARNANIVQLNGRGWTSERIGKSVGLTGVRVRQILRDRGVTLPDRRLAKERAQSGPHRNADDAASQSVIAEKQTSLRNEDDRS